jgi:hypothetical protein
VPRTVRIGSETRRELLEAQPHGGGFADVNFAFGDSAAVGRLARHLHSTMERLDPSQDSEWDDLTEAEQDFYRAVVREMLREIPNDRELVLALSRDAASRQRPRKPALQDSRTV